jgi:transcriptional regulator with GAF, ATPase, and Fis domain
MTSASSSTETPTVRILLLGPQGTARDGLARCLTAAGYDVDTVVRSGPEGGPYEFVVLPWEAEAGTTVSLSEVEHRHLTRVLDAVRWNVSHAARILGVDRATIYNMMRRFRLERPRHR